MEVTIVIICMWKWPLPIPTYFFLISDLKVTDMIELDILNEQSN